MEKRMDIRQTALSYLEHRMRTTKEMRKRLLDKGFSESECDETIVWLKESRYLDDVSYGSEYLRYGFEKRRSINRIKVELKEKGLTPEDTEQAIFAYEDEYEIDIMEEEYSRAQAEAKRIAQREGTGEKAMAKAGRRLSSLGYSASTIYKVLGEIK